MRTLMAMLTAGTVLFSAGAAMAVSQAQLSEQACREYGGVQSALTTLRHIGPNSTIGEVRDARNQLQMSYGQFSATAKKVAAPETERLDQSIKSLNQTVNTLPPEATGQQAQQMIKGDIARIQVAKNQLLNKLGCPSAPQP